MGIRSPLRHLDPNTLNAAARKESRNREIALPPVSVYRWWARRTEAVTGAVIDALSQDFGESLLIGDPFVGGGVGVFAAAKRGHRVYAQDLNPWAIHGLSMVFRLAEPEDLSRGLALLASGNQTLLKAAYGTTTAQGLPGAIAHSFRVATSNCHACGFRRVLFPYALVSMHRRKDTKGAKAAILACRRGHLFNGVLQGTQECPECGEAVDPGEAYLQQRIVTCAGCGSKERLSESAARCPFDWDLVLVERVGGGVREIDRPTPAELAQAESNEWEPTVELGAIPEGHETAVLLRHGFSHWQDLYPRRQRYVTEQLIESASRLDVPEPVRSALITALVGTTEMAGLASRWDRWYLKSYEAMSNHRFNFTTLSTEPHVMGTEVGRGTLRRRIDLFARAASWVANLPFDRLKLDGPLPASFRRRRQGRMVTIRVVEGSSERMLATRGELDAVVTDPPYHDDVQYGELSMPLRAWAGLDTKELEREAIVSERTGHNGHGRDYCNLLKKIFLEIRRSLRCDGHLVLTYANRELAAWEALFSALSASGLAPVGYHVVHAENETDRAKTGRRSLTYDLLMDLVNAEPDGVEQWRPTSVPDDQEGRLLQHIGDCFLSIRTHSWQRRLLDVADSPFLAKAT